MREIKPDFLAKGMLVKFASDPIEYTIERVDIKNMMLFAKQLGSLKIIRERIDHIVKLNRVEVKIKF